MSIPTHQVNCTTKTRPTSCPDCGVGVFYFACSCGSKTFFDDLGFPWELHTCRKYRIRAQIEMIKDVEQLSDEAIYKIITDFEKRHGVEVDDTTLEMIESVIGRRRYPLTSRRILPFIGSTDVSGVVMELNDTINIFKKLGYDAGNEISIRLLGTVAKKKWSWAFVKTKPDSKNSCQEYEMFIAQDYLKKNPMRKNDFILGYAKSINHPKGIFWELSDHKVIL